MAPDPRAPAEPAAPAGPAGAAQLLAQGQVAAARALLHAWLQQQPGDAASWQLLGLLHLQQGEAASAQAALGRALALDGHNVRTLSLLAVACVQAGAPAQAIAHFDQAVALAPGQPDLWHDRGRALFEAGRLPEALASFERTLALAPRHAQAWLNCGNMLRELGRVDEALASLATAARLVPQDALVLRALGETLERAGRASEALAAYQQARQRDPGDANGACTLMHLQQREAQWSGLPALFAQTLAQLDQDRAGVASWALLSHPGASGADLLRGARAQARTLRAGLAAQTALPTHASTRRRLRIGYLSADFREHAMAYLMAGVFEQHERADFEVIGIDLHRPPVPDSPMRQRLGRAIGPFVDAGAPRLEHALATVRALGLDIAVDLMGLTRHGRPELLAQRVAPIQVGYLGFPGTCGIDTVDYILGDRWVTPVGADADFAERIVRLPDSFQANDHRRVRLATAPPRSALGLPEGAFVFCCLNNTHKIGPQTFDVWMRLLHAVPGSVLWLLGESPAASQRLRAEAQARGIEPARLVFATRRPYADYLAQFQCADLFVDTWPFNAGTTASDALWAGLPVLTQAGATFAGRMAASLLDAVGLPELITHSTADYEALALRLAREPARLQALRTRLAAARNTAPLFDTRRFTRQLEAAYRSMGQRHQQGLPPASFDVAALA